MGVVVQKDMELLYWDKKRHRFVSQKSKPKTDDKIRITLWFLRGTETELFFKASRCPVHTSVVDGQKFVWIRTLDEVGWEQDDGGTIVYADEYESNVSGYTFD